MGDLPKNYWRPRLWAKNKIKVLKACLDIAEKESPRARWELERQFCRRDLFYLCVEVLGYKDLAEPLHDDLCDFLRYVVDRRLDSLVLIPRAHFKSTIGTVGLIIQEVIRNRNIRIGLFSGDMKNARKFANEIRMQMENNERLKSLFPDVFWENPKFAKKWTTDEFTVKRDPEMAATRKEGTVKIFGLLQNIPTGDHYDLLIGDDIVDQDIVGSEGQMEKIEEQFQYLTPLQQTPTDPIHLVGTRYHLLDIYGKLVKDKGRAVYFRKAIENDEPIFPERFNKPMLDATRIKIGNYKYFCQYEMDPQDPADKKFRLEWLKDFEPWPATPSANKYYSLFMMVDPANKQKKESDFSAMLVFAIDHDYNVYILDGVHDKLNPHQRIEAVFNLQIKWNIPRVGYETIAFQDTDAFWIKREMEKRGRFFQIIEISHRKQNKFDFIMSIQPICQGGQLYLPNKPIMYKRRWSNPDDGYAAEIDVLQMFRDQYDLFPNIEHDDLLDDVALAIREVQRGNIPQPKKREEFVGAYRKKVEKEYNPMAH